MINEYLKDRLSRVPVEGRKLLCVIVHQAYHGSLQSKEPRIATMPEVHEACGLDVDGMYAVLRVLCDAGLIELTGHYPFEEIRLTGAEQIAIEDVMVDLRFDSLSK